MKKIQNLIYMVKNHKNQKLTLFSQNPHEKIICWHENHKNIKELIDNKINNRQHGK